MVVCLYSDYNAVVMSVFSSTSGWDNGCLTMQEGEKARLTIDSELGYGSNGFPSWGYPFIAE